MPLRVLLVAPIPPPSSGIGTWAAGLIKYASRDPDVTIVHIDTAVRFRAVGNLALAPRLFGGVCQGVVLLVKLISALLFKRIDVAHICTSGSLGTYRDIAFFAFARLLRVPTVVHLHFGRLPAIVGSRNWEVTLIEKICRLSTCVIVLDSASGDAVRSLIPDCPVSIVANPAWKIDQIVPVAADPTQTPIICYAGHVLPTKGVRELVSACRDIDSFDFQLEVIGPVEQEFEKELREIACTPGRAEWFKLCGPLDNAKLLTRMGRGIAVVLPSYTEGFPNVVLEAMMLGKAVVATPVGAIPNMLSFEGTEPCGICVPVGDVNALKVAIETLLSKRADAQELGRRARERVTREYSPGTIYSQLRSIWASCAVQNRAGVSKSA